MTDTLIQAYVPLLVWPGIGLLLFFVLPDALPRWLGRSLYWVGIPLEIFALARQTPLNQDAGWSPVLTVMAIAIGALVALVGLQTIQQFTVANRVSTASLNPAGIPEPDSADVSLPPGPAFLTGLDAEARPWWDNRSRRGSFMLSSILGNTNFVGLAIAPLIVSNEYLSWVVFYSVINNVLGTYGLGVFLASYYGRSLDSQRWWTQLKDVLTVPSLWAFAIGILTRNVVLPSTAETVIHNSIQVIIPMALMLMGMRISQIRGWSSLRLAVLPASLKVILTPALIGCVAVLLGLSASPRLALILMSGMPTAFAGLILAEEYDLDRDLIASSIVVSSALLLLTIPLWLLLFGDHSPLAPGVAELG